MRTSTNLHCIMILRNVYSNGKLEFGEIRDLGN